MSPQEMLVAVFETMTEQLTLPEGFEWAPLAGMVAVTVLGLVLLLRGAKWAPGLAALTFLAAGGWAGAFLAKAVGTPLWPTAGVAGVLAAVLGIVMFRFWQALLLAACCIVAGLSIYFVHDLVPEVHNWYAGGSETGQIELPAAGMVVTDDPQSAATRFNGLITHLGTNVPNFTPTVWSIVLGTGLVGLIFGLLLPRASRSLWAATLGTVAAGIGCSMLLKEHEPAWFDWLMADNTRAWMIVGAVWLVSLVLNLISCRPGKHKSGAGGSKARLGAKPALA